MIGTLTTNLALFAVVAGLSVVVALHFIRAARRQQSLAEKEKERLLDEIWELKATASALNKAEAANEAKSRFLAMVSHEVRTPLTGILGMAELLTATELTAEQLTYVDAIRLSGESLSSLINEILDFSKIEAGKLDLNQGCLRPSGAGRRHRGIAGAARSRQGNRNRDFDRSRIFPVASLAIRSAFGRS